MNELIEKLAVQSLVEYNGELIFSKEKFAELIVRECAEVASGPLSFTEAAYCRIDLLKHFGIQE